MEAINPLLDVFEGRVFVFDYLRCINYNANVKKFSLYVIFRNNRREEAQR
jgi:hypothetical protein